MKPRTLLVLLLVALGLGAFIYFVDRELPSTEERARVAKKVLGALETDAVRTLALEHEGQTVRLSRSDELEQGGGSSARWRLEAPIQSPADSGAVDSLVRRLVDLEFRREVEGASRVDFGLLTPSRKIRLGIADGRELVLELGDDAPVGGGVVVAVEGKTPLYLVDTNLIAELEKPAGDWRDRQLLAALRNEVASVRLFPQGVLLGKRGDGFWLEAPLVDRADEDHVTSFFTTLSGARIEAFVDDPPALAELGLDPPAGGLEVLLEGEEVPVRIDWGSPTGPEGGRFWARRDGQVVETTAAFGDLLARVPAEWRSRVWSGLRSWEVQRLTASTAAGELEVARTEGGSDWLRGEVGIGYAAVSDLLYAISSARAVEIADPHAVSLGDVPDIGLTLATADDQRIEGLRLFRLGEAWWGPAPGREAVLRFEPSWVAELEAKIAAVAAAEAEDSEPHDDDHDHEAGG